MQSLSPAYIKTPARAILPQNGAQEGKQVTTKDFREKTAALDGLLGVGQCFDMTARDLTIGGRAARLWVVNGYAQEDILERVIAGWQSLPPLDELSDPEQFCRRYVSACDAQPVTDRHDAIMGVFAGKTLVVIDGFTGGLLLDVKHFPTRSVEEPDTSRVLRGSHDGFVENLMQNAALLRRRIRDPHLRLERIQLPERSATDVALCYMEGEADEDLLRELREKLAHLQAGSIAMSQESIVEAIAPRQFWNPFPTVRYTERPDVATACIMEGDVVMLVDNSPAALLLPTTLLRFNEEINDYYFPPLIGTYLQVIRTLVLLLTMFITPLWYLLVKNPDTLHESLHFLLVPEVLVYMAFVAVANYDQHSYEMGYATKLCRMVLLVLIWLWDWWGFAAGVVLTLVLIATTKPLVGKGYLYPLIPFDRRKLLRLLYRRPINRHNS